MPVVMTIPELERLLGPEFPQAFHPGSGLSIEALWEGGCRVRQAFPRDRCARAARFPARRSWPWPTSP